MEKVLEKNKEQGGEENEDIKKELAKMYLMFLDQQKGGIIGTGASLGINLNPFQKDAIEYLTSDTTIDEKKDIFKTLGKNIKKKFMEKLGLAGIGTEKIGLEYDKAKLDKMRTIIIANKDNKEKLQELMTQIQSGIDPTTVEVENAAITPTSTKASNAKDCSIEYLDKTEREKVLNELQKVIERDKQDPINYFRGGKEDLEKGLDCSGLIYYALDQAGLKIPADSRSMFNMFETKKLELEEGSNKIKTDISDIQEGDIIRRNSTNKEYRRKTGEIPEITKNGITYRIHHVAFIKSIDKENGIVTVVESNGSEGVTESKIDIAKELANTSHKSELYVAHIDYHKLEKKTTTPIA